MAGFIRTWIVIFIGACSVRVSARLASKTDEPKTILIVPFFHASTVRHMAYIGQELCSRGHKITLVLNKNHKTIIPKNACGNRFKTLEYQYSEEHQNSVASDYAKVMSNMFEDKKGLEGMYDMDFKVSVAHELMKTHCKDQFETQNILHQARELKPNLVIVDATAYPPCLLAIPYNISVPFVTVSGNIQISSTLGLPWMPSVSPNTWWPFTSEMTFSERIINLLIEMWITLRYTNNDNHFLPTYAPGVQNYNELIAKASLSIITWDHHLEYPEASMPYTLMLPGLTITSKDVKPLPAEITEFLGSSDFVVVSFGSVVNQFPKHVMETFLDAFKEIPSLKFVCYLKQSDMHFPPNVRGYPWLPQNDLLGHANVRLFIHHCGNAGQYEAAYHGVPMIGFPLFLTEHDHNCRRVEFKGLSKTLHIQNFTKAELVDTIKLVLSSPDMYKKAKKLSAILKSYDPPVVRAADAIDHVAKFGGEHLNGATRTMPAYKLYMLDIFAVVFFVLLIVHLFIFSCCFSILKRFFFVRRHLKDD